MSTWELSQQSGVHFPLPDLLFCLAIECLCYQYSFRRGFSQGDFCRTPCQDFDSVKDGWRGGVMSDKRQVSSVYASPESLVSLLLPLTQHATPFEGILCMGLSPSPWMDTSCHVSRGILAPPAAADDGRRDRGGELHPRWKMSEPESAEVGRDWFLCWLFMQINGRLGMGSTF